MIFLKNIKHYIISIFALFFLLLTNNTASAIEKEIIFPSQNYLKVEFVKQVEDFVFSSANSEYDFSNPKNYIRLSGRECDGKVGSSATKSTSTLVHYTSEAGYYAINESKHLANGSKVWNIRDASGNIMATYHTISGTTTLKEQPIYASGRIGMGRTDATGSIAQYTYELTDHLGNVRATFTSDGDGDGAPDILSATNYYPFGHEMLGSHSFTSQGYRFGYQGQFAEKDGETGYSQFELRLYDRRAGRWLSTDPYGQYWSPYLAMGNNPVLRYDINGGISPRRSLIRTAMKKGMSRREARFEWQMAMADYNTNMTFGTLRQSGITSFYIDYEWTLGMYFSEGNLRNWGNYFKGVFSVYNIPVVGSAQRASDALSNGQYLLVPVYLALGVAECAGIKASLGTSGAISSTTNTVKGMSNVPRSSLNPTHYLTKSRTQMKTLLNDIRANGINEPIKYVEHNGSKFIVDGHHRFYSAQKLGIQNVPVQQVKLPYGGYKSTLDLMMEPGKMPGYWKYLK